MRIRINHHNRFEDLWIDDDEHGGLGLEPVPVIEVPTGYVFLALTF
jgi:hypothetical protein